MLLQWCGCSWKGSLLSRASVFAAELRPNAHGPEPFCPEPVQTPGWMQWCSTLSWWFLCPSRESGGDVCNSAGQRVRTPHQKSAAHVPKTFSHLLGQYGLFFFIHWDFFRVVERLMGAKAEMSFHLIKPSLFFSAKGEKLLMLRWVSGKGC